MPKLIEGLKERIVEATRDVLFSSGIEGVTVRTISSRLEIAPGTIYNYFSSKEMLLASVFLQDWMEMKAKAALEVMEAKTPLDALEVIFHMLKDYTARFSPIWRNSSVNVNGEMNHRHKVLKEQISEILSTSPFFKEEWAEGSNLFLSEILLSYGAGEPIEFEHIRPFLERLVK